MWLFNVKALIAVAIGFVAAVALMQKIESRALALVVGILIAMAADAWTLAAKTASVH